MLGMTASLFAAAAWLLVATWLAQPVSTTHTIIGAIIGMAVVAEGAGCVSWMPDTLLIVLSWVTSPVCAGATSGAKSWRSR